MPDVESRGAASDAVSGAAESICSPSVVASGSGETSEAESDVVKVSGRVSSPEPEGALSSPPSASCGYQHEDEGGKNENGSGAWWLPPVWPSIELPFNAVRPLASEGAVAMPRSLLGLNRIRGFGRNPRR